MPDDVLAVKVTPRASKNRVVVTADGLVKVYVTAPPVDGEANQAAQELLAKALKLAKSNVILESGQSSRDKVFRLVGVTVTEAKTRLTPQGKLPD